MTRERYPEDEARYPWLAILLDAYEISDEAVRKHLMKYANVACSKGCSSCCRNYNVPMLEPELSGISWYVVEKLVEPLRSKVKTQLERHADTADCPFLVGNECAIYQVRPLICRQFYIVGPPCLPGEDVALKRQCDVVSPKREIVHGAAMKILEYWNINNRKKKEAAFEGGLILKLSKSMHTYDWREMAIRM